MIDDKTFENILSLCRFRLDAREKHHFKNQIGEILSYVEMLAAVDTKGIDPDLGKALPPPEFRLDTPGESLAPEKLETLTPHFNGLFTVPQIIEELDESKRGKI